MGSGSRNRLLAADCFSLLYVNCCQMVILNNGFNQHDGCHKIMKIIIDSHQLGLYYPLDAGFIGKKDLLSARAEMKKMSPGTV